MNYHSNLVLSVLRKVVISNFILLLTCVCSSCRWQEAKNIIAIADSIDQTEHVIYDDTMALKRVCSHMTHLLFLRIDTNALLV